MLGKVLAVAIDRYPTCPLNGCLNDGEDFYNTLVQSVGYDPRQIRYLANDQATKANILKGLEWAADAEFALCFYAGHGSLDSSGKNPILVPHDYDKWWNDPLDNAEIARSVGGMRGVMIYDCCHSGSLASSGADRSVLSGMAEYDCRERCMANPFMDGFAAPAFVEDTGSREAGDLHVNDSRFVYISGCRNAETSKEARVDGKPRGLFSSSLCRLFRENPGRTVRDLWESTSAVIQERVDAMRLTPQHPQLWGSAGLLDQPLFGGLK